VDPEENTILTRYSAQLPRPISVFPEKKCEKGSEKNLERNLPEYRQKREEMIELAFAAHIVET
jgi:hypothetical protein